MQSPSGGDYESARTANAGWVAGGLIVLAIFAAGAFFWFTYHP